MNRLMNRRAFIQGLGILSAGWTVKGWTAPLSTPPFSSSLSQTTETRNLMGTFVTLTLLHPSREQAQAVLGAAFRATWTALIRLFNRHDPGSALSVLNERGTLPDPPPELLKLLERFMVIHARTGGLFDVTIKPVLDLYESEKERGRLPAAPAIREALSPGGSCRTEAQSQKNRFFKRGHGNHPRWDRQGDHCG